jgi:hypothetical protein
MYTNFSVKARGCIAFNASSHMFTAAHCIATDFSPVKKKIATINM